MGIGETPAAAPEEPVESVLTDVATRAMRFFTETMPVAAQLAGEPEWVRQRAQRGGKVGSDPTPTPTPRRRSSWEPASTRCF
jgi:hypothetical protein